MYDDYFSGVAKQVLRKFQGRHHLKPDGIAGPRTQRELAIRSLQQLTQLVGRARTIMLALVVAYTGDPGLIEKAFNVIRKNLSTPLGSGMPKDWGDPVAHHKVGHHTWEQGMH